MATPIRKKYAVLRFLTSYKITIFCLFWLGVITFWGTLYQVDNGLYITKQRMFNSWLIMAGGVVPLPSARLVLWLCFINLVAIASFRFVYQWSRFGVMLTHAGIILLLVGSGFTLHFSEESSLTLREGYGSNVAADYNEWELALWTENIEGTTIEKEVSAYKFSSFGKGSTLEFADKEISLKVEEYLPNSNAFTRSDAPLTEVILNASGIVNLKLQADESDVTKNIPGLKLAITSSNPDAPVGKKLLLYGAERNPTQIILNRQRIFCSLRRIQHKLPIVIELIDFVKKDYPGTRMAKSFSSKVKIKTSGIDREVLISMNKPLRHGHYTFYQSSFSQNQQGESSTLSVVYNPGRLIPYISSLTVGLGMIIHFFIMMVKYARRIKKRHLKQA